jgi:uridine kinase
METVTAVGFEALSSAIDKTRPRATTKLIAIDGRGGAGKSTLARRLADRLSNVTVVEVDDFWLPGNVRPGRETVIAEPGSDYDWERLRDQAILPLSNDEPGHYQRYDWSSDSLMEWHDLSTGGTVVVEGVFSTREELTALYDVRIWVETPESICLERGYDRDGSAGRELWDCEWMPAYEQYIKTSNPRERADYVVDGLETGKIQNGS